MLLHRNRSSHQVEGRGQGLLSVQPQFGSSALWARGIILSHGLEIRWEMGAAKELGGDTCPGHSMHGQPHARPGLEGVLRGTVLPGRSPHVLTAWLSPWGLYSPHTPPSDRWSLQHLQETSCGKYLALQSLPFCVCYTIGPSMHAKPQSQI